MTGAKLPLAMPNGQNRPPAASSPNAASPMSPPTPSNTTSTSPATSRTCCVPAVAAVVDGQVGPEIPRDRELARLAGQCHDPGPGVAGDLHQQRPHASGRGLDQDGIARAAGPPGPPGPAPSGRRPAARPRPARPPRPGPRSAARPARPRVRRTRPCRSGWPRRRGPATVPPTPLPRMAGSAGSIDG